MSDSMTFCSTVNANPDVSGIGVRTAIYAQNLLSFVPALWALKDGRITPTELDELEKQSTTILITAFAILISTVIQALNHGISNYHASIVLDLSWMNNTNLFIYFLLYIYHRFNLSEDEFNEEVKASASHALPKYRIKWLSRWIYETKKAMRNSVIIIGSSHLSFMAAVGIWLWSHPVGFGGSKPCSLSATVSILGTKVQLGSVALQRWSVVVYSTIAIPMLNLLIPITFFTMQFLTWKHVLKTSGNVMFHTAMTGLGTLAIIDVIMLVDTEVAIKKTREQFNLTHEGQWTFGQTLAVLLLLVALRDLIESILEKRAKQLDDQLLEASKNGERKSVESLLRRGARCSRLDACIWGALVHDHSEIVHVLLDYGANPNSKDIEGRSLLHFSVKHGYLSCVWALLEHQADVNFKDDKGLSPLISAAREGFLDIVKVLLEYGASVKSEDGYHMSPLHYAADKGQLGIVKVLLENHADVNVQNSCNTTPLHFAAEKGHLDIVKVLLENHADVNVQDSCNTTPLHFAAEKGHLDIVKVLLGNYAHVNVQDVYKTSPLHFAAKEGHLDIVKVLLEYYADVNLAGNNGFTAFDLAEQANRRDVIRYFLR